MSSAVITYDVLAVLVKGSPLLLPAMCDTATHLAVGLLFLRFTDNRVFGTFTRKKDTVVTQ